MRVYLDNCCFNRPFDDQSQVRILLETEAKLVLQDRIRSGEIELAWSYVMEVENNANPFECRRTRISTWRSVAAVDISESDNIINRAESLSELGFRAKDALHLSCAIEASCQIFLTTDDGILSKSGFVPDLAILNPVDYNFTYDD